MHLKIDSVPIPSSPECCLLLTKLYQLLGPTVHLSHTLDILLFWMDVQKKKKMLHYFWSVCFLWILLTNMKVSMWNKNQMQIKQKAKCETKHMKRYANSIEAGTCEDLNVLIWWWMFTILWFDGDIFALKTAINHLWRPVLWLEYYYPCFRRVACCGGLEAYWRGLTIIHFQGSNEKKGRNYLDGHQHIFLLMHRWRRWYVT